MKKATTIFSACIIVFCIWIIYLTFSLKKSIISYDIGPAVYPRLLCYCLIITAILLFLVEVVFNKHDETFVFFTKKNMVHITLILIFLFAIQAVGFPICTFLMIGYMMHVMGCPRWWEIVLISAITSILMYLIFRKLFLVRLPIGILGFLQK